MSLPSTYQTFIHLSRYARWRDELGRRETFTETVDRYFDFFNAHCYKLSQPAAAENPELKDVRESILKLDVMPSMRTLMTAGEALRKDNCAGYNCAYTAINHPHVFDEIMYILMCGTGVGFSVEAEYVNQLPAIAPRFYPTSTTICVGDSKIGWATSYRELISLLYAGKTPKWDMSAVRPAGTRLKTFGGRASGPEPLNDLFQFTCDLFRKCAGRKLSTLDCHDLVCKIADIVVVGGVRRSALISLSDLEDVRMREAKTGEWWTSNGYRALANNSAKYREKPEIGHFLEEWTSLIKSKSGERGIINLQALQKQAGRSGRRDANYNFGTNPCSEIILRDKQFCNLSEVVARHDDTLETLIVKVRHAAILGTLQSTLTNFRYLSDEWRKNCEEERLLGVSITGIMDCPLLYQNKKDAPLSAVLDRLREEAVETNKRWAELLGVPQSTAVTCVKPSGTVSQLVDAASGIHPRYDHYYIRTVRADKKDPLALMMRDMGFPVEDDVMKKDSTDVFSFPMKAPETAVTRNEMSALDQLRLWLLYQKHWCEHKPSITVYCKDSEWLEVGAFVYKNFDEISGISFLPYSDHNYKQAPYQPIDEKTYLDTYNRMPQNPDWSRISEYEKDDETKHGKELACTGGSCDWTA